jgi:uncharacterized membrane protein (DUF106 family)
LRVLNSILAALVSGLLYPFRGLPPIVGLTAVSLLTSVAILLVFRATSDQKALRRVKNRIVAGILEIRLFRDDLRAIFRAQLDILRHSLTYLRLSLVPMLWVIVPIVILLIQLQFHYGYRGLAVGEEVIVKVRLRDRDEVADPGAELALVASEGLTVATPMLWIPSESEADWRVMVGEPGEHRLTVRVGQKELTKSLTAVSGVGRRSPRRPSAGIVDQFLYPVERPVPGDAPVEAIEITYAAARVSLLGWKTHWMVAFFILTVVFAFALQKPLRVTI